MTNLEALNGVIGGNYPFDTNIFEKALGDQKLDKDAEYDFSDSSQKAVDYATMNVILTVVLRPSIDEGGYKVSDTDKQSLLDVRNSLRTKYGLPVDTKGIPTITGRKVW